MNLPITERGSAAASPMLQGARAWRTPSWNTDYAAAKADLATRLDGLIAKLARRGGRCPTIPG